MAAQHWLQAVDIPAQQIHSMPTEHGAEQAAELYEKLLNTVDIFDMVLLGLGEDGHTASLFPGHIWPSDEKIKAIPVHDAPKPPADRVSLTPTCLANTHALIFMVEGAGKLEAVKSWRDGEAIPAAVISPICGVDVYIHENAMPK
jgi:6-phosphogluconolactonase